MKKEIIKRLLEEAKKYSNLQVFIDDIGWEDWMEEYISDPEYSEIYGPEEKDKERIDKELKEIFDEANKDIENIEKCYSCSNYNKETGYCDCITYNICGITIPNCFPNGCRYHNVTVLVPMVNCMDDTTITTENYKKCLGCVRDCIRKGKNLMEDKEE